MVLSSTSFPGSLNRPLPSDRLFKISEWIPFKRDEALLKVLLWHWTPWRGSLYKRLKSCISVPYSPFSLLAISLIVSQNWTFWGLVSQCRFQVLGFLHWERNSSLLGQKLLLSEIPLNGGSLCQGRVFGKMVLCLSYLSQYGNFILSCGGAVQLVSGLFQRELLPM